MRKLLVVLICLFCGSTISLNAQIPSLEARDAEWKSYSLPQSNFTRHVTPDKTLVFRVPADWKKEENELAFVGPHGARLSVAPATLPAGYPLTEYVAGTLTAIADEIGSTESILTRRTQFQDLEAREIYLESPDQQGKMFRSTTWITITGPLVVRVNLLVDVEHATQIEPLFKATVQSVMFVPASFAEFESSRLEAITPAAGPIHELENIVASLNELNSDREAAINRLTPLFVSQPGVAVDLLIDRRAVVRSAAAEALARSRNNVLRHFLWYVLEDSDPFVAEAAARRLGPQVDIAAQLLNRSWSKNATETIARVWPFMSQPERVKFMQGLFNQKTPDKGVQTAALILLRTMRPDEFKLPLARILTTNYEPLTIVALRVANDRGESLPVDSLMKLATSTNEKIKTLAVESLGQSAAVSDIARVESLISKAPVPTETKEKDARKAFDDEIKLSVKKIRFRNDFSLAKTAEERREIIRKAALDSSLEDFAWRFDCELTDAGCAPSTTTRKLPPDFRIKSFAENLFPQKVTHYSAIPNPAQAVQRFYETLHGLQLDSPRAQSSLILMIGSLREKLGQELGAPSDAAALIDYTGIKPDSPIVLGSWAAAGARDGVGQAQRRAVVVRVKDRQRFERVIDNFQQASVSFPRLTDFVAIGTRAAAALPALLPFSAQAVLAADPDKPARIPHESYSVVGQTEWNGIPIKTIEHRWLNSDWELSVASTYLAFIGDVAILTEDVATIRDLLSNATTAEQQLLAGNEEFRHAVATGGDIVYFSDLKAVFASLDDRSIDGVKKANESGALKFSTSSWENSHRFVFDDSDWSKPFLPFHPKDLSAPRELLPSSTLAYVMTKLDVVATWKSSPKAMNLGDSRVAMDATWALEFEKEVLPELGPECGAVLLEVPNFYEKDLGDATWAVFCKLKSNKLSDALTAGKLFRGVGPTADTAEVKDGDISYFVAARNGFLVVSNNTKGLSALDGKTNLAAARDYSRAVERSPAGIVAFGGYNLEAAIAAASRNSGDGLRAQIAGMVFSIATAFHSQSFFATATAGTVEGRSSVAMDREGRYAVADFNYLPRGANITFATIQPHGMPIHDQNRLSDIVLKVRAKAPGPIDSIRDDIKLETQKVEQKSPNELVVTVAARRNVSEKKVELPVTNPELATFLKATGEITSDDKNVIDQARQIAGEDRDAWSVARKLADWTHKNLEWKSVARAGAAETLATREADCSEFSQLYVSMARSLGLPARIVSGLAYSGNSFGGHAWVEVWAGEWIELDPTWGTHFVDATHIRNKDSNLVTAAALNLIDVEVLETRRTVAEFQKSPKALAQQFANAIASGDKSEVEATLDIVTLTNEFMGAGAWAKLNDNERSQISSAYRRVAKRVIEDYSGGVTDNNVHVLHVEEKGERAEALCYVSDQDLLLKLQLLRRDNLWYLVDVVQPDPGLQVAAEKFGPVIRSIEANRAGKKTTASIVSDFDKAMALIDSDAAKAVAEADRLLQSTPKDQIFRFLKMMALWETEVEEKQDESIQILTELSDEQFAPAVYRLAGFLTEDKPEEAIELYKQYSLLEPHDFRPYRDLGSVYETTKQSELAEAAYRKAIELDPLELPGYEDLAIFLIRKARVAEVPAVLVAADKYATEYDDVLSNILGELEEEIKLEDAERLAALEAPRMKKSLWSNLGLADIYIREKRYPEAVDLIKRAVQIDPDAFYPHYILSTVYLKQSRLNDALKSIDQALSLAVNHSGGHYIRASVLARMGRKKDAMAALEKSIELDGETLAWIIGDEDFKSLRTLPAFQKLLEQAKKLGTETVPPQ